MEILAAEKNADVQLEDVDRNDYNGGMLRDKTGRLVIDDAGFVSDDTSMPKGYYYSPGFLCTVAAIGLGFYAGVSTFAYAAPVLATINQGTYS